MNQKCIPMALRKFTEEQVQEAKALRTEGLTYAEIGRRMGIIEQLARYLALRPEVQQRDSRKKVTQDKREEGVEYFKHDRYYM
jgi:hypothetical protein